MKSKHVAEAEVLLRKAIDNHVHDVIIVGLDLMTELYIDSTAEDVNRVIKDLVRATDFLREWQSEHRT